MADFTEVIKQWKRMCEMYRSCDKCPMQKDPLPYTLCSEGGIRSVENLEETEETVMQWAAEHPEPVYPTWVEWFRQVEVVTSDQKCFHEWLLKPIPADIAEKLGIEPKEG